MEVLIGIGTAIATVWLLIVIALIRAKRRNQDPRAPLRLVPDLARLLTRLARDRTIPLRVRARIYLAILYNVQPINLIPDFIPVIGLLDNVVVTAWAIRSTVKHTDDKIIARHWPGTSEGPRDAQPTRTAHTSEPRTLQPATQHPSPQTTLWLDSLIASRSRSREPDGIGGSVPPVSNRSTPPRARTHSGSDRRPANPTLTTTLSSGGWQLLSL
jgi:uncharacterized membrane protein YkvA (DUF1232 family)